MSQLIGEYHLEIISGLGILSSILIVCLVICCKVCSRLSDQHKTTLQLNKSLSEDVRHLNYLHRVFDELIPFISSLASEVYVRRSEVARPNIFNQPIGFTRKEQIHVFITEHGSKKFHTRIHGSMLDTLRLPVEEAILKGFLPCAICCPPLRVEDHSVNPLVWFSDSDPEYYHRTYFCQSKLCPNGISVLEACQHKKLKACPVCQPPAFVDLPPAVQYAELESVRIQLRNALNECSSLQERCNSLASNVAEQNKARAKADIDRTQSFSRLLSEAKNQLADTENQLSTVRLQLADTVKQLADTIKERDSLRDQLSIVSRAQKPSNIVSENPPLSSCYASGRSLPDTLKRSAVVTKGNTTSKHSISKRIWHFIKLLIMLLLGIPTVGFLYAWVIDYLFL